jgi:hypothetical protein
MGVGMVAVLPPDSGCRGSGPARSARAPSVDLWSGYTRQRGPAVGVSASPGNTLGDRVPSLCTVGSIR